MYSEWASRSRDVQTDRNYASVLHKFPDIGCKDVVHSLAASLNKSTTTGERSNLETNEQIRWTMQVLCYGLDLPLSESDTIRDCVSVYCEWLTTMTHPKPCVPTPILEDPNPYCREMLHHLHNLFVPRLNAAADLINRQAVLCHRVLRCVHDIAKHSTVVDEQTWEAILIFLLGVNDALLAPPTMKDGIGDQMCARVLSVLFEVWIITCVRHFPSVPLWKTFRETCANWRHHEALIKQWHRVNTAFTAKVLYNTYGPDFPQLQIPEEDHSLIPDSMDQDCVAQSWFRFLHILADPSDLTKPLVISKTPKFLHMALTSDVVIEPHQHDCLKDLPRIFLTAMEGVSVLVDAFLGISSAKHDHDSLGSTAPTSRYTAPPGNTPPGQRKTKGGMTTQGSGGKGSKSSLFTPKHAGSANSTPTSSPHHITLDSRPQLAPNRPKVNSILHLFGAWLIEAAMVHVKVHGAQNSDTSLDPDEYSKEYEAGRAEACGTFCRIMCSHKTGEDILPVYLARFYLAVYYGLDVGQNLSGVVLSNIIFNSCDLLRINLDGVLILAPQILKALTVILEDVQLKFSIDEHLTITELRKASIHLLLSMLCLPLHFKTLPIKDILGGKEQRTFMGLKMPIIELLFQALHVETDAVNTQMLLGGLMLCVQDMALCEEAELAALEKEEQENGLPNEKESGDATKPKITMPQELPDVNSGLQKSAKLKNCDTSRGLFGHAASLVCNRLMASWKTDLNIALAAIEVLCGLAKVRLNNPSPLMCKRTVNWICEFICYQCSRPAPAHSKDLHSMIVAAFHCLTLWLVEHDYLMQDKECLLCVLEVVELGISGSKSQTEREICEPVARKDTIKSKDKQSREIVQDYKYTKVSDTPKLKGEKESKPVSLRVKDAAEGLLTVIMDHVGSFPPPCGPESVCSLLDEECLMKYCKDGGIPEHGIPFKYFVLDGTTIVGLLEQPLGNDEDPLPTVTSLIRGPFGRHAWTMRLRHLPRHHKVSSRVYLTEPPRPQPMNDVGVHHEVKHRIFPEVIDSIPLVKADRSIPKLESTMAHDAADLLKLQDFIKKQIVFEEGIKQREKKLVENMTFPDPETECKQPEINHDFQTARLFLSHYGFLSLEALKEGQSSSVPPPLVSLDNTEAGFLADLEQLDTIPCRTTDTVHVFYVKAGQKMPWEILNNVTSRNNVQPTFMEFLRSLGWPVDVKKHAGWTGNANTSWKIQGSDDDEEEVYPGDTGGSLYDGKLQVLYWADVTSQVAFVVPSPETYIPLVRRTSVDSSADVSASKGNNSKLSPTSGLPKTRSVSESVMPDPSKLVRSDAVKHRSTSASSGDHARETEPKGLPSPKSTSRITSIFKRHGHRRSSSYGSELKELASEIQKRDSSPKHSPHIWRKLSPKHKALSTSSEDFIGTYARSPKLIRPKTVSGTTSPMIKSKSSANSTSPGQQLKLQHKKNVESTISKEKTAPHPGVEKLTKSTDLSKTKSLSLDLEKHPDPIHREGSGHESSGAVRMRRPIRPLVASAQPEIKVMVVWLESYSDYENFPAAELLPSTSTDPDCTGSSSHSADPPLYVIFIHALQNGLFRIHMQGTPGRINFAIPLVEGMVVSRRSLGAMVRQTAVNICRRKRLESEAYLPPHSRRKLKIKEIVEKYRNRMTEPEFYTALFQDAAR